MGMAFGLLHSNAVTLNFLHALTCLYSNLSAIWDRGEGSLGNQTLGRGTVLNGQSKAVSASISYVHTLCFVNIVSANWEFSRSKHG